MFSHRDTPPVRRADECAEQLMRLHRFRFELRVELAAEEPGMIRDLADLDVGPIRRLAGESQAVLSKNLLVLTIELITVPVAFANRRNAVRLAREAALRKLACIG